MGRLGRERTFHLWKNAVKRAYDRWLGRPRDGVPRSLDGLSITRKNEEREAKGNGGPPSDVSTERVGPISR